MNQTYAAIKVTWTRKGKHSKHADRVLILAPSTPHINALDHLKIVQIFWPVLAHLRSHRQAPQKGEFVRCHWHVPGTILTPELRLVKPPSKTRARPRVSVVSEGMIQSIRTSG